MVYLFLLVSLKVQVVFKGAANKPSSSLFIGSTVPHPLQRVKVYRRAYWRACSRRRSSSCLFFPPRFPLAWFTLLTQAPNGAQIHAAKQTENARFMTCLRARPAAHAGESRCQGPILRFAGGKGEGLIFRKGEILYKAPQEQLVDKLMEEIEKL